MKLLFSALQLVGTRQLWGPSGHPGSFHLWPNHSQCHLCGPLGMNTASQQTCDQEPSLRVVELPQVPHPLPAGDVWTHFSRDRINCKSVGSSRPAAFLLPNLGIVMDGGRRSHITGTSNLWDLTMEKVSESQERERPC